MSRPETGRGNERACRADLSAGALAQAEALAQEEARKAQEEVLAKAQAWKCGRCCDGGKIIGRDPVKAADLCFHALEDGLADALAMFVDRHGADAAPNALAALQDRLAACGAKFDRAKGRLTASAATALEGLAGD